MNKPASSRMGRHVITDPFLRFYYRFLARRQSQLALGVDEQALEELQRHLVDFIGTYTWEELCQEWLLRASGRSRLPFLPDQVGGAWTAKAQIDVMGYNRMQKTLILGECKWGRRVMDVDVLENLVRKTAEFIPAQEVWRVHYLGFSRMGWSPKAYEYAAQLQSLMHAETRWHVNGMELLDLGQVDDDLEAWSGA